MTVIPIRRERTLAMVRPIDATVRPIDERYFDLHRRCATGAITSAEIDELEAMIAEKELEYELSQRNA